MCSYVNGMYIAYDGESIGFMNGWHGSSTILHRPVIRNQCLGSSSLLVAPKFFPGRGRWRSHLNRKYIHSQTQTHKQANKPTNPSNQTNPKQPNQTNRTKPTKHTNQTNQTKPNQHTTTICPWLPPSSSSGLSHGLLHL